MTRERPHDVRPPFEHRWRNRFEEYARLYDDDAGIAGWSATGLDARVRRFLGLWEGGAAGPTWLDAGCGAGTYTRILLGQGRSVVAVDYSLPTLRKAAIRSGGRAALAVAADVRKLPFREGLFDGVICFGVTQALSDSRPAVHELATQVKPGGELWLDALNRRCIVHAYELLRRRLRGHPMHLRYESPLRLARLLKVEGFGKLQIYWLPILPSRWHRLQRLIESRILVWVLRFVPFLGMLVSHAFIVRAQKLSGPQASRSRA